ncbi:fructuronate reductase [Paenarthrobacter nitroguajacolicus]|uniref:mannitol dehydrogenase family protein n=1 Tax=Paenarthrobacter nitroguajacolicus TaxID=211146 RepID=UPI00285BD8FA|nr:mannitol dehydrogenase family protein [Paenarthrobacter nitroguajacolicus]MDR6987492.1 fructuronate reductase [Paenarthrobacter nitroguajacolicus]
MERLSNTTLAATGGVAAPLPRESIQPGIVHLGLGAFARAHTAVFTENAMLASGDFGWGIVGVTQRSDAVVRQLVPQDGLYTVTERGGNSAPLHVMSSIVEAVSGRDNPETVVQRIAARTTSVVTLTITEKGYRIDPRTGSLNVADEQVQADLAGNPPLTALGQITRGIQQRARQDSGPLTVVSCDNLPGNGELTGKLVRAFASALPHEEASPLLAWIDANVTFPNTMVDRMVPATTSGDLADVERQLGLRDEGAVVAEPFMQWVIEDNFAGRRPRWEDSGALFSTDVAAWEAAKLRLLNASHSMLAYLGLAAGKATIADAVADVSFRTACERLMFDDVLPTIDLPSELDAETYCKQVLERFSNPALGHTTAKVGSDGSQKIGLRLLSTVRDNLDAGREPRWAALAVAAWMHHVATTPPDALDDPMASELQVLLPAGHDASAVVPALLACRSVFDEGLASNAGFVQLLMHWYAVIDHNGPHGLGNEILHG